jgi:hypothetical protein
MSDLTENVHFLNLEDELMFALKNDTVRVKLVFPEVAMFRDLKVELSAEFTRELMAHSRFLSAGRAPASMYEDDLINVARFMIRSKTWLPVTKTTKSPWQRFCVSRLAEV